jgi:hypothetical protein
MQKTLLLLYSDLKKQTIQLMKKHPESHFFMDECPVGINGLQPGDLKDLSDELSEDQFLWIACQTQKSPPSEDIESNGSLN